MNILEEIIAHKKKEIECAKNNLPLDTLRKSIDQNEISISLKRRN